MDFNFNTDLCDGYKSPTQKIRVMSESWITENAYCVKCGSKLLHFGNNKPVGDVYCEKCQEEFELKSKKSKIGKKICGSAYSSMISKIEAGTIPNFFYLNYSANDFTVKNLLVIPKHYFTKEIIIERPPLSANAKRAGWIGCNIDISSIPDNGKIYLIQNGIENNRKDVIKQFNKTLFLRNHNNEIRGWLLDIIKCIELLNLQEFSLEELYVFEAYLKLKHPKNNNIKPKIRQQVQILRDYGYLVFLGNGKYKLL